MTKIAIIGSNGYIGRHLVGKILSDIAADLFLFDVSETSLFPDIFYKKIDLNAEFDDESKNILRQSDFIFAFAGLTGTHVSNEKFANFVNVNEIGLLKILDCIKTTSGKKPKVIFPSTRLIYKGVADTLLNEEAEKEFKTIYALNKYACEQQLKIFNNIYGIPYTIFRICVPYGNAFDSSLSYGTLSHFISLAKAGNNITLFGDGLLKRTFTHVGDLSEVIVKGGLSSLTNNMVLNIGSKDNLSLLQVATEIASIYKVQIEFKAFPDKDKLIESGDTMFDDSQLRAVLNYNYKYSFFDWIHSLQG